MREIVSPLDGIRSPFRTARGRFSPAALFAASEPGVWYDPSDLSTLFQDAAGTTAVTGVEQPVGLMLDKSRGLVLGSELVTNGNFATDTNWTKEGGWSITGGQALFNGPANRGLIQNIGLTANVVGKVTIVVASVTTGGLTIQFGYNTATATITAPGTYTYTLSAGAVPSIYIVSVGTSQFAISSVSVKLVAGNHLSQSTSASRPVLSARYNMLTYTEQFDNAYWAKFNSSITANATSAPNGTTTADALIPSATNGQHSFYVSNIAGAGTYTSSISVKAFGYNTIQLYLFDGSFKGTATARLDLGTVVIAGSGSPIGSITSEGNGWYRVVLTATTSASTEMGMYVGNNGSVATYVGDTVSGVYIWGADLRVTNDGVGLPAYQRVTTATDYDTSGFPSFLRFDGTDDSLATGSIDFSATDKMSVFAGLRKLSDDTDRCFVELSATVNTSSGAFGIFAPSAISVPVAGKYVGSLRGTAQSVSELTTYTAPTTNTLSAQYNIAGASIAAESIYRVNGSAPSETTNGTQAGTGSFGNYPLYIGRRGGTTLPFSGRLYSLIVRGAASTDAQIASAETWVNGKTGAY